MTDFTSYIRENVGKKEHIAFMDRLYNVIDSVFKKKQLSVGKLIG